MARLARVSIDDGLPRYAQVGTDGTITLIEGDILGEWSLGEQTMALSDVRLLAPVIPPNIIAIGLNYRAHARESGMDLPERPVIFLKATTALTNPGSPIVLPEVAPDEVDYECELAMVIGKLCRHVTEEEALDYVLGYTCSNDVSARDCQRRLDVQWARAKSFDTFAPMGPWIETELDPDEVGIRTRLNGDIMQESNTDDLIFSCRQLVSYISHSMTMLPGTVIMTGTPQGVGFARTPAVFLRPGDAVEVEIDGIGTLKNPVVSEV